MESIDDSCLSFDGECDFCPCVVVYALGQFNSTMVFCGILLKRASPSPVRSNSESWASSGAPLGYPRDDKTFDSKPLPVALPPADAGPGLVGVLIVAALEPVASRLALT